MSVINWITDFSDSGTYRVRINLSSAYSGWHGGTSGIPQGTVGHFRFSQAAR